MTSPAMDNTIAKLNQLADGTESSLNDPQPFEDVDNKKIMPEWDAQRKALLRARMQCSGNINKPTRSNLKERMKYFEQNNSSAQSLDTRFLLKSPTRGVACSNSTPQLHHSVQSLPTWAPCASPFASPMKKSPYSTPAKSVKKLQDSALIAAMNESNGSFDLFAEEEESSSSAEGQQVSDVQQKTESSLTFPEGLTVVVPSQTENNVIEDVTEVQLEEDGEGFDEETEEKIEEVNQGPGEDTIHMRRTLKAMTLQEIKQKSTLMEKKLKAVLIPHIEDQQYAILKKRSEHRRAPVISSGASTCSVKDRMRLFDSNHSTAASIAGPYSSHSKGKINKKADMDFDESEHSCATFASTVHNSRDATLKSFHMSLPNFNTNSLLNDSCHSFGDDSMCEQEDFDMSFEITKAEETPKAAVIITKKPQKHERMEKKTIKIKKVVAAESEGKKEIKEITNAAVSSIKCLGSEGKKEIKEITNAAVSSIKCPGSPPPKTPTKKIIKVKLMPEWDEQQKALLKARNHKYRVSSSTIESSKAALLERVKAFESSSSTLKSSPSSSPHKSLHDSVKTVDTFSTMPSSCTDVLATVN